MKNFFKITFGLIACMTAFTACNDEEGLVEFQLNKTEITVDENGGIETIDITSDNEWVAKASEPWITLSPANGAGSAICNVAIDTTIIDNVRTATITFMPKGQALQTVTVNQTGFGNIISIKNDNVEIEATDKIDKRYFIAEVVANVKFTVKCTATDGKSEVDWLTFKQPEQDLDFGSRPRTSKVRFDWKMNTKPENRIAKIEFLPVDPEQTLNNPAVLTLTQKAAPLIEDNRAGDSLALLIIQNKMNTMVNGWDVSENMRNWDNVTLWEEGDKDMPKGAAGRVRSASFMLLDTKESIPEEVKHLTYLESLAIQSNTNTMMKSIDLSSDICELDHLKKLTIFAYGLVSLPDDFHKLGNSLEYLDLSANNFETIPAVLNSQNFPKMKGLKMVANRRWTCNDLTKASDYDSKNGIGMHITVDKDNDNVLRRLFTWESLEYIGLSNNYIEGELPEFTVGQEGFRAYTEDDIAARGDTLSYLVSPEGQEIPRVMPNLKFLALNLNFFTGKLPKWVLYHPYLMEWIPSSLLFPQQEKGINSEGNVVKFSDVPSTFDYYYDAYPRYRAKYEMKDEYEEE